MEILTAQEVFRDHELNGVHTTPKWEPPKSEVRQLLTQYETVMNAFTTNGGLIYQTMAAMNAAATTFTEPRSAWQFEAGSEGVYVLNPTTDTWTKVGRLPYDFVIGTDTGAGTANAIQITADIPVADGMIVAFSLFEATTTSPVTVSINGGAALTLKTPRGTDASALGAGQEVWFRVRSSDSTARMISDQDVSALVAQAEAARDDAVAAAAAAAAIVTNTVEHFGATSYTLSELLALNGAASIDTVATANTIAFNDALQAIAATGGGTVYARGQFYILNGNIRIPPGAYLEGAGYGRWLPSFPNVDKTWTGTNLVAKGTGPQDYNIVGITSMKNAGGWRTDPDNGARSFKLASFMNADATGSTPATPKDLSVFIANETQDTDKGGLRGFRVVPWIGTDGISDYDLTSGSDLGADWDIGVLLDTVEGWEVSDVQVRGYWREVGLAEISPDMVVYGRSEANIIRNTSAQGLTGVAIRSGDIWKVQATTASTLEVLWSEESYWPASGGFEGLQNGTDYTYTSLSRNGANLVFNGVSPNPTGTTQIRNTKRGTGFSTGLLDSVEGWALYHHSGQDAEALGFGRPSQGMELSGFPLRGLHFVNVSAFGEDAASPCVFFHDCDDAVFLGGKFEIGHVIASPFEADSAAAAPVGSTSNLRLVDTYVAASCDLRLFTPRSVHAPQLQINPGALLSGDMLLKALAGQDFIIRTASGKTFIVESDAGADLFTVTSSGNALVSGQVTVGASGGGTSFVNAFAGNGLTLRSGTTALLQLLASGTVAPGASGANFGTNTLPWGSMYGNQLRLVDGITAPSTLSGFALLYVDTADGDLKIKFGDGTVKTIVTDT